jgi:trans-2,3-dihydro-3-hydroxyanthranilate isomerase
MSSRRRQSSCRTRLTTTGSGSSSARRATSISTAEYRYTLLDVFTDVRLAGNQLAVVHDADGLDDATMLAFAIETKLAETTYVQAATEPSADYRNRIFCMAGEMPFAGHPSLGTAVAVARARGVTGVVSYIQQTQAGHQPIDVEIGTERHRASMLQEPAEFDDELDPAPLLAALGLSADAGAPELPPQVVSTGLRHVMLPLADAATLSRISPDPHAVDAALEAHEAFGLYASWSVPATSTARARMFGRSSQILEDPATGSAGGPLCAYLNRRTGIESVTIAQGVEMGRASTLEARIEGDRVRVGGGVVVVVDGRVTL